MKLWLWSVLALVVAAAGARADDTGLSGAVPYAVLGVVGGLFDIGATVYDAAKLASGERAPRDFGIIETLLALPQVGSAAYIFTKPPDADGVRGASAVWFVWATALAAHGIWTTVSPAEPASRAAGPASRIVIGVRPVEQPRFGSARVLWSVTGRF